MPHGRVGVDRDHRRRPRLALHRLAVEDQPAVAHLDRVAGQADHALDIVVALARRGDDDDVAALGHLPSSRPCQCGKTWKLGLTHDQP